MFSYVENIFMKHIKWNNSLSTLIPAVFVFLIISTLTAAYFINEHVAKSKIQNIVNELINDKAELVVTKLQRNLSYTESLTRSLALLGNNLKKDKNIFKETIPKFLKNNNMTKFIAGGGVWPAPYMFNKDKERSSFFWAKNIRNQYEFINDYNKKGAGYHNEEWYVPAKYIETKDSYWSKSYIDPYSKEQMVTCTVPYKNYETLNGVATIDLKLSKLAELLESEAKSINGYIFAVDRNNKLLTFPKTNLINDSQLKTKSGDYITLNDLVKKLPYLTSLERKLSNFNLNFTKIPNHLKKLAIQITKESYQIDKVDAKLIVKSLISSNDNNIQSIASETIENDPILNDTSIVSTFLVPKTHWKIIAIAPMSLATAPSDEIMNSYLFYFFIIMFFIFTVSYFIFRNKLLTPLKEMHLQLLDNSEHEIKIPNKLNNEVAEIALLFNNKTFLLNKEREKAKSANHVKDQFLAAMSHEIRTPLNGIIGTLDVLTDSPLDNNQKELTRIIQTSSSSLLAIITDILDFSKLQEFKIAIKDQPYKLDQLLEECISLYKGLLQSKGLEYELQIDPNCPNEISLDPIRVKQIVNNLFSNAVKFTDKGKVGIKVSGNNIAQNEWEIIISIYDTGIGINEKYINKLFKSFSQIETGNNRSFGGTGLGLVISKKLSKLMGGDITVISKPNCGTTFSFNFLTKKADSSHFKIVKPKVHQASPNEDVFESTVLVVEDNLINQKVISKMLEKLNIKFEIAENGQIALDMIKKVKYPLVLMDIQMPVMDGLECMKILRKDYHEDDFYIVALTANALDEDKNKCLNAGANVFTTKPITTDKIKTIFSNYFESKIK